MFPVIKPRQPLILPAVPYLQFQLIQVSNIRVPAPNFSVPPQPVNPSATTTKSETFDCNYCDGFYRSKYNLKRHIKIKHPDKFVKIDKKLKCSKCERTYSSSIAFKKHERLEHGVYSCKRQSWLICPICSDSYKNLEFLCCHVTEKHSIDICRKTLEFPNQKEFLLWKNREELETKALYVKHMSSKCSKNKEVFNEYYYCNRSGFYKSTGKMLLRLKSQGSSKIGGFCTSHMKVKILQGGKHCVQYVKTHVGHTKDLSHLRLSKAQKDELASKIRNNVSFNEILEEAKSSSLTSISRLHLLTKKDLYNIRNEYGLDNKRKTEKFTKNTSESGHLVKTRREKIMKKTLKLEERHLDSLSMSSESVVKYQDGFIVPSSTDDNEMFVVQLNLSDCSCNLRCKDCSVCVHNFTCTCFDATIKGNMCKHIHLVCRIDKAPEEIEETPSAPDTSS